MDSDHSYVCSDCGEEIVIPIDLQAGRNQEYVEDCPVCCHPQLLQVTVDEAGQVTLRAQAE